MSRRRRSPACYFTIRIYSLLKSNAGDISSIATQVKFGRSTNRSYTTWSGLSESKEAGLVSVAS